MVLTARRGQFFIIGTLLIAALITGYVILDVGGLTPPQTQTPQQLFDHALNEFPAAVNYMSGEDPSTALLQQRLTEHLAFQQYLFAAHGTTAQIHALVTIPDGDNVTLVLANFHGQDATDVRVTVDGTTETVATLPDETIQRFTFTDVPRSLDVRAAFEVGRSFNQSLRTSRDRQGALFHLRVQGQNQVWSDTRRY